jgi:hypothetical protein
MFQNTLMAAAAAALATLLTPAAAPAWGVTTVGYTHVGPYGAYQVNRTTVASPYGYYGPVGVTGSPSWNAAYNATMARNTAYSMGMYPGAYGYGVTGSYYGVTPYGAGYAGGYRYVAPGVYGAGVYRGW